MKTFAPLRHRPPMLALLGVVLIGTAALGQPTTFHKTVLQESPFPGNGVHSVLVRTTIDAKGMVPSHTHPGLEFAYVQQGEAEVVIGTAAPLHLKGGDSFQVPPKTVHSVRNAGAAPLVIVSNYEVDPAAPIAAFQ